MADEARAISIVLKGLHGPITVNGKHYNREMPPFGAVLSEEEVADVITDVRLAWRNEGRHHYG